MELSVVEWKDKLGMHKGVPTTFGNGKDAQRNNATAGHTDTKQAGI